MKRITMRATALFAQLALLFVYGSGFAGAESETTAVSKPIRTLSFQVRYGSKSARDIAHVGIPEAGSSNTDHFWASMNGSGTLAVDILARTGDSGLVAAVTESVDNRKFAKTKFGITSTGDVIYDPALADQMHSEIVSILRLLAIDLLRGHDISPGASWSAVEPIDKGKIETHFIVHPPVTDNRASLEIDRVETMGGARRFDSESHARFVYDFHFKVPISGSVARRIHQPEGPVQQTTIDETTEFELLSDSFQPAKI